MYLALEDLNYECVVESWWWCIKGGSVFSDQSPSGAKSQ